MMKTLAVLSAVALLALASTASAQTSPRGITVSGTGSVATVPNRAELGFGVVTNGKTASAAMAANSTAMTRVIAAIKGSGIEPKEIATSMISLQPRTNESGNVVIGYTAANSVSVTLREIGKAGDVIDAAVRAGANTVDGPNLSRSDTQALYDRALRAAVANARHKALALAKAAGVRLGRATTIIESGSAPAPLALTGADAAKLGSAPIEAGTQVVRADVTVTFAIR